MLMTRIEGGRVMKKKSVKAKAARNLPAKTLSAKHAKRVKGGGGRKAGKGQQEYLVVKMNDTIVTNVQ
jgi:hypothetical protein